MQKLRAALAHRLPFYYGWVIFALTASTSYAARPLMSVSVLSVFVLPMTEAFGWSRGLFAGAVSVGGLGAVVLSPLIGRVLDKYGAGLLISAASAVAGLCAIGLATVSQVWAFYALYVPGRTAFASPLELATTTALSNWFIRRRPLALALFGITQGTGLAAMPLVAQLLITKSGWQTTWVILGVYSLLVGVVPPLLLMARRPEDMGLAPDLAVRPTVSQETSPTPSAAAQRPGQAAVSERHFTLQQALRTRAFWILALFSATGFMAQAGVSLHHVSHYIQRGFLASSAALMAGCFAFAQVPTGLLWAFLPQRLPMHWVLALAGGSVALGAACTALASTVAGGVVAASILGSGVGGLHFLLRLAWAEYYGREHLGAIRGVTLPAQLGGQALGPVTAGILFDVTGSYQGAFLGFAAVVALGSLLVLTAVPPRATAP